VSRHRLAVPLSDIAVDAEIEAAVERAVVSGWWSMGPRVAEFEQAWAAFCGVKSAIGVANGTAALHLALLGAGVGHGDEVILPSLNFVAAANSVAHVGAVPVFCDVKGEHDLNLDPEDLEAAVGPRTKAVIALHYAGFPCDMDALLAIAERQGFVVIEDAAHAPGASVDGRMCGALGDIGCFSFFANKNLPVGEGGMVVTNDATLAERVRLLRSHGMTRLTWDHDHGHAHGYDVVSAGFNYRLDELRAAVGLVQLGRLQARNAARARIVARYRELLDGVDGLSLPFGEHEQRSSAHHLAVVLLPHGAPRPAIQKEMERRGVQTSVHYPPIHRFSAYAAVGSRRPLPRTERLAERLLTLPLYAHMTDDQVEAVAEAVCEAVAGAATPAS
jgi:dTDP-4-amino-4,6-dideoxygalactose transaminase